MAVGDVDRGEVSMVQSNPAAQRFGFGNSDLARFRRTSGF
jgi:hypothetical protein